MNKKTKPIKPKAVRRFLTTSNLDSWIKKNPRLVKRGIEDDTLLSFLMPIL